ncbi:DUF4192 domain-containing protein [Streptomyces sp. NPDC056069]|uniref:DUF4192 domain-containing protein n=1 Tax=Streptomyces sp. NPDC056069 TaxID=3345702 RepID=UPI0035E3B297
MNANHHESHGPSTSRQITLRGPAELADALPFMLGFHPSDSVVLVALHGERGRFGGRVRVGIPGSPREWSAIADYLAECLVEGSTRRSEDRPDAIVAFLCQEPAPGETGKRVMERLRPLAQRLRTACGALDIPVLEALCISDGLYFSYCCPDARCCPPDGTPLALSGTSVMAASAAYAGIQVRGTLKDMEARLKPRGADGDAVQRAALDEAAAVIVPRLLDAPASGPARQETRETTLAVVRRLIERFSRPEERPDPTRRDAIPAGLAGLASGVGTGTATADARDDELLTSDEAATVILGLQDRETRDQAAEWMEGPEALPALRLWRALSRRCVAPYQEYAAAPLTLAGWVAWSTGDEPSARVALGLALDTDPDYLFARLLHQACNEGLDPESLRDCLRRERDARVASEAAPGQDRGPAPGEPGDDRAPTTVSDGTGRERRQARQAARRTTRQAALRAAGAGRGPARTAAVRHDAEPRPPRAGAGRRTRTRRRGARSGE